MNEIFESQSDNSARINDDDDFNPRANTQPSFVQSQNLNSDFGDFTTAFNSSTNVKMKDNNDEFADFTSAFNSVAISNLPSQPQSQTVNLMGATVPTVNSLVTNNANMNNTMCANNIQTAGATIFSGSGAVVTPSSKISNDLFDSLPPQSFNSQITNNNTGTIYVYLFLQASSLKQSFYFLILLLIYIYMYVYTCICEIHGLIGI